jgi:hypothetical protein
MALQRSQAIVNVAKRAHPRFMVLALALVALMSAVLAKVLSDLALL